MYEKILIPLDGSKLGEAALPCIEELVSKIGPGIKVEITVLQVISSVAYSVVAGEAIAPVPYTDMEIKQIEKRAMEYLDTVSEVLRGKGAVVTFKVGRGNAAEEILKASDEMKADLIAMSSRGRSGLSRWAFGSVTDRVLHAGTVPVLVVRASAEAAKT